MTILHSVLWWAGFAFFIFILSLMPPIRGFFVDGARALKLWFISNKIAQAAVSVIAGLTLGYFLAMYLMQLLNHLP